MDKTIIVSLFLPSYVLLSYVMKIVKTVECNTTHPSEGRKEFSEGAARGKSRGKPIPARTWMCSITFYV